jgi:hypothetical protein
LWNESQFASKVLVVKTAIGITAFLLAAGLCGSQAVPKHTAAWHWPDDRRAIRSQEPPKPYNATGLPDGTVSVFTKYRQPGLRVRRPDGEGFWEFEGVARLYYHGKMFAIVGTATGVSDRGEYLGYVTSVVIYDEDGDGKLESPVNINGGNGAFVFHLPSWVAK